MSKIHQITAFLAVLAITACAPRVQEFEGEESADSETDGSDTELDEGEDKGSGSGSGDDDDDDSTTGDDDDDDSTTGDDDDDDSTTGDDDDDSTTGDDDDDDSTTGDDDDDDSTTGDDDDDDTGGDPGLGDLCHPLDPSAGECPEDYTCAYDGWNNDTEQYEWSCKVYEGNPGAGDYGHDCEPSYDNADCQTGFSCTEFAKFPEGDCGSAHCCMPHCDPDLEGVGCPENTNGCDPIGHLPELFPSIINESTVDTIGLCI